MLNGVGIVRSLWLAASLLLSIFAQGQGLPVLVVAQDGSGQFRSIQAAIEAAQEGQEIYIKNGVYGEKLFLQKSNLSLRGQSEKGVVITASISRDIWRCSNPDDWGAATVNVLGSGLIFEKLTVLNTFGFDLNADTLVACASESSGTKTVRRTGHQFAFRSFPGATRLIFRNCTFRALGGDTVSPWDVDNGMYYFKDCTMEGGVDFYCPRGWAYAENCRFICHNKEAAIWHDGSKAESSRTVLVNCRFEGDPGYKLGRYHRESQFCLINCRFSKDMADADIDHAPSGPGMPLWGRRVYYYNCKRKGGNYAWHRNNLPVPPATITPLWTFDGRWDPISGVYSGPAYSTDTIAEKMLLLQRVSGGWPKAIGGKAVNYALPLPLEVRLRRDYDAQDATIDNQATTREITYLIEAYERTKNPAYLQAVEKGLNYLLAAQYPNGGWPQFYPNPKGYQQHITFNDGATARALEVLRQVSAGKGVWQPLQAVWGARAKDAVDRGIQIILATQILQNGKRTGWCQQHDRITLQPAKARSYELPSIAANETAGIVRFLMKIPDPGPEIRAAIEGAIAWMETVKITGWEVKRIDDPTQPTGKDAVLAENPASVIWARFYDLETNVPFFCGRDGERKASMAEVENERRVGYAWYGDWPEEVLKKEYPKWVQKWKH